MNIKTSAPIVQMIVLVKLHIYHCYNYHTIFHLERNDIAYGLLHYVFDQRMQFE